jgi:hypothetical protein
MRGLPAIISFGMMAAVAAQSYPPAFPRTNATKLLETDRFVVWDIVWPKGQPTPLHRHVYDQVGTYYAAGGRVITTPDGTKRSAMTEIGALSGTQKGTTHIEEGTTDPPLRAVFIELKQEKGSGVPEAAGEVPAAFPREGARSLRDDERVAVWDYTWTAGSAGARRYPRETVIIWLGKARLRVAAQRGQPALVDVEPGRIRHYTPGQIENLEVLDGAPRSLIVQFN